MYLKDNKKQVNLRISLDDFEFCKNQAASFGWSVSHYIRYLIQSESALTSYYKESKHGNAKSDFNNQLQH